MSAACHLERVALYTHGAAKPASTSLAPEPYIGTTIAADTCEYCDAATLEWRKCKQICSSCGQINRSCADL